MPISGYDARFGEDYEAEAFVPRNLPDSIDLPGAVWMAVSEAAAELGRLDAAASLVANAQLIARSPSPHGTDTRTARDRRGLSQGAGWLMA